MNVFVNAAHSITESGTIYIYTCAETKEEEEWVQIKVNDTGSSIAAENINRIFEPFFTTKPVDLGTGPGLSLGYGIMKKHNGSINVESEVGK